MNDPSGLRSKRVRAVLWMLAGAPLIVIPLLRGGNIALVGVGVVFVMLGLAAIR